MSMHINTALAAHKNFTSSLIQFIFWGLTAALIFTWISFGSTLPKISLDFKPTLFTFGIGLILYSFLSIALSPITSAILTSSCVMTLHIASNKKIEITGEPLIFGDISHLNHISIALKYTSNKQSLLILAIIIFLSFYIILINKTKLQEKFKRYIILFVALFGVSLSFHPIIQYAANTIETHGLPYYSWDFPQNQKTNGLVLHLIQTGKRPAPIIITEDQKRDFRKLADKTIPLETSPNTLIMILCESCWYDNNTFKDAFTPLSNEADAVFRGVSPIFGGGTPNATFEFLTALPARNSSLSGIIYQEYRDYFSALTSTLPSHLQSSGFRTESIHNYLKDFWFRSTVEPKLGFDRFTGIEDIDYTAIDNGYPSDTVLFKKALSVIEENHDKNKLFMHLATMYTHGPYRTENDDGGVEHYRKKLSKSILDIREFVDEVRNIDPYAIILVYGDHKPGLPVTTKFIDQNKHMLGDVPVLLFDPIKHRAKSIGIELNEKPFYCISSALSRIYYGIDLPVSHYTKATCKAYDKEKYEAASESVPAWLYSAALFSAPS